MHHALLVQVGESREQVAGEGGCEGLPEPTEPPEQLTHRPAGQPFSDEEEGGAAHLSPEEMDHIGVVQAAAGSGSGTGTGTVHGQGQQCVTE